MYYIGISYVFITGSNGSWGQLKEVLKSYVYKYGTFDVACNFITYVGVNSNGLSIKM